MNRLRSCIPYILVSACMQVIVTLWVPIFKPQAKGYIEANLFEKFAPRSFMGTVAYLLGIDETQFIFLTVAALFAWILGISLLIATPRDKFVPESPNGRILGLIFLFSFSNMPFATNADPARLDIFAAIPLVAAAWLVSRKGRMAPLSLAGLVMLMGTATLIHEKSIFECFILLMWVAFTQSGKSAAGTVAGYLVFLCAYLGSTAGATNPVFDLSPMDYLGILSEFDIILLDSVNLFGILCGGGLLWALYARLAAGFVHQNKCKETPFPRFHFVLGPLYLVLGMFGLCFIPLLIGVDTTRMVSIIWLPTLLLVREMDWPLRDSKIRLRSGTLLVACALQALIPPVFVCEHTAWALNCYALFVVDGVAQEGPVPFTVRIDPSMPDPYSMTTSEQMACAPVYLFSPFYPP